MLMGLVRSHLAPCSSNAVPAIQVCGAADAPQVPAMLTTPMYRHTCSESPVHPVQVAILQRLQRVVSVRSVLGRARCTPCPILVGVPRRFILASFVQRSDNAPPQELWCAGDTQTPPCAVLLEHVLCSFLPHVHVPPQGCC